MAMLFALLVGRATGFDPSGSQGGDRTETPDAGSGAWAIDGDGDLTLPETPSTLAVPQVEEKQLARAQVQAPRGRLFVDEIFRPPISVLA
jgi:hypothetical protein